MNKEYILQKLSENSVTIKNFGVRKWGLFGSYARGDEKQASDMDFLVEFEKKTFDNYMDLKIFLQRLFDCKVDLVISDAVKLRLRKPIFEETIYACFFKKRKCDLFGTFSAKRRTPNVRLIRNILNYIGSPNRFRTGVSAVRGRCPRPLDDGTKYLVFVQIIITLCQEIWRKSISQRQPEQPNSVLGS